MDGWVFFLLYIVFTFGQIVIYIIKYIPCCVGGENDFSLLLKENCSEFNTCAHAKSVYVPNCYCDKLCHVYDDCCIDHVKEPYPETDSVFEETQDKIRILKQECMPLYGSDIGAYFIQSCSDSANNDTNDMLAPIGSRDIFNVLPVVRSNNVSYRNKYIAECNNITDFVFWKVVFEASVCSQANEIKLYRLTAIDIANYYLQQGCEYALLPPDDKPPRFCLIYHTSDDISVQKKIPIRTSYGLFRNEGSCKVFTENENSCINCNNFEFEEQFTLKFGSSMNALFKISSGWDSQEKEESLNFAKIVFRNLKIRRQLRATTPYEFQNSQWDRAAFFYQLCVERAFHDFKPHFTFNRGIYFEKDNESYVGNLNADFDLENRNEIHSHIILSNIITWFDRHRIKYSEVSETETTVYDITTSKVNFTLFRKCPECFLNVNTKTQFDDVDKAVRLMENSKQFPSHHCLEIHGRVVILRNPEFYSFHVSCKTSDTAVAYPSVLRSISILRYVLLFSSLVSLCTVVPFHMKISLHSTIFGYSFLLLIFVSFINQAVTTFIEFYIENEICYVLKLISRTLTLVVQSIAVYMSAIYIFLIIKMRSTSNDGLLNHHFHIFFLIGLAIGYPLALTCFIYQLSKKDSKKSTSCDHGFFVYDEFMYASWATDVLLIVLVLVGYVLYHIKGKGINLLKGCVRYQISCTTVAILHLTCLIVLYLGEYINIQVQNWALSVMIGLQIPLSSIPFYFQK